MTAFNVSIPDNKISFFQEFLDMIGARYEKTEDNIVLSDEQKRILDKQEDLPLSEYQDSDEFLEELKKEYGL